MEDLSSIEYGLSDIETAIDLNTAELLEEIKEITSNTDRIPWILDDIQTIKIELLIIILLLVGILFIQILKLKK